MIKIYNSTGLVINLKDIDDNILNNIISDLTVVDDQIDLVTHFYFMDKENIYIPKMSYHMDNFTGNFIRRYCVIENDNSVRYYENNKKLFEDVKMLIEPKNELQLNTIKFLTESNSKDKSLFLSPGSGKTAMSIMYFVKNKLKPLILTPDKNLSKQWRDSILEFTNIKEDDIFEFENGVNSMNKKTFKGEKKVYIACVKTFSSMTKKDPNKLLELKKIISDLNIDIKIIDECHLNLNAIFKTVTWFPTVENLYLSATMNRRNIQENVIHPSIVEPYEAVESVEYEVKPRIVALLYNSKPTSGNIRFVQDMSMRGAIDFNRYFNNYLLSPKNEHKIKVYLDMIDNLCSNFLLKSNDEYKHKIIIVGPSIKLLERIYDDLSTKFKVFRMYAKYKEKPKDENYDIIIGTQQQVTQGFDVKSLDVMISISIFTSSHNIKQLIGRILRSYPGKKEGVFIPLIDEAFSAYIKYAKKMATICETELSNEHKLEFTATKTKFQF